MKIRFIYYGELVTALGNVIIETIACKLEFSLNTWSFQVLDNSYNDRYLCDSFLADVPSFV